jgi:Phage endonuclease I
LNFRSKYEETVYNNAEENGFRVEYEPFSLAYLVKGNYYPDFVLENGIIVEAKGYFDSRARAKMIAVKKNNPDLDIRMLFMNSRTKVRKGSKLTYADWCEKYKFPFADGMIPIEWFSETSGTSDT